MYLSRTICDVLKEIRTCHETRNYSYLMGLVEEAQSMSLRMEAALDSNREYRDYRKLAKEAYAEYEKIQLKLKKLKTDE